MVEFLSDLLLMAAIFGPPLAAQDDEQTSVIIPLRSVVTPAPDGESLELNGTLAVGSRMTTAADGTKVVWVHLSLRRGRPLDKPPRQLTTFPGAESIRWHWMSSFPPIAVLVPGSRPSGESESPIRRARARVAGR